MSDLGITNTGNIGVSSIFYKNTDTYEIKGTIESGQGILPVGTVLSKNETGTKYIKFTGGNIGLNPELIEGVLGEEVDATSADVANVVIYVHGQFLTNELTAGVALSDGAYKYGTLNFKSEI
jgi:hypothetical protein